MVDKRDRVLSFLDGEIGEAFQYLLRRSNVTFRLRESVAGVQAREGGRRARPPGVGQELNSETVLYAVGRQGDTEALGLANAGLEVERARADRGRRASTAPRCRTSSRSATSPAAGLAATAMEQGRIAALHAFDQPVERAARAGPDRRLRDPRDRHGRPHGGGPDRRGGALRRRHRALERARPRADDRGRGRDAEAAGLDRGPLAARRARDRDGRHRPRPHRAGGDGRRRRRRLPR